MIHIATHFYNSQCTIYSPTAGDGRHSKYLCVEVILQSIIVDTKFFIDTYGHMY